MSEVFELIYIIYTSIFHNIFFPLRFSHAYIASFFSAHHIIANKVLLFLVLFNHVYALHLE